MHRLSIVLSFVVALSAVAAEPIDATEEQVKMYLHYKLAMADSRVQAMKPEARVPAIAKDAGYKLKDLQNAISKVEAAGDLKAKCEANFKEAFATGLLADRTVKLELDLTGDHAIAIVQWLNEEQKDLGAEASWAARTATDACPVLTTTRVWAHDKAAPKQRVFQAVISQASAKRFSLDKVKDYGSTRYWKMFEHVKSVTNGDDLSAESAAAAQP